MAKLQLNGYKRFWWIPVAMFALALLGFAGRLFSRGEDYGKVKTRVMAIEKKQDETDQSVRDLGFLGCNKSQGNAQNIAVLVKEIEVIKNNQNEIKANQKEMQHDINKIMIKLGVNDE